MTDTTTAPKHLTVDIRELAHLNHGFVPYCLRCIAAQDRQVEAGTMPKDSKELGFKGRGGHTR